MTDLAAEVAALRADRDATTEALRKMNGLLFAAQQDANAGKTASAAFIDKCVNDALDIGRAALAVPSVDEGSYEARVRAFSALMVRELRANAHKDAHPLSDDRTHLIEQLREHVDKFADEPTEEHAADVANLAMLILTVPSVGGEA